MNTDLGTFYQGQLIQITIKVTEVLSEEQKVLLTEGDVYIGIYRNEKLQETILSTKDGTLVRDEEAEDIIFYATIRPAITRTWSGSFSMELLVKSSDNKIVSPCENIISFNVEPRRLAKVIG